MNAFQSDESANVAGQFHLLGPL
eukprot:COSAG01_NODE_53723_length_337_cov_0.651261_1_plen_22_part_10